MGNTTLATSVPNSNPGFVGFNLADFSITPIVRKGERNKLLEVDEPFRFEWQMTVNGKEQTFFVEREYHKVAPNAYTEDFLLLLGSMARRQDNPRDIPLSSNAFYSAFNYANLPSGVRHQRTFDHLEALRRMSIDTNAIYNREKGEWLGYAGSPVSNYTYREERKGNARIRRVNKGDEVVPVHIRELLTTDLDEKFYRAFLAECIEIDFTKYFNVGGPTARRLYKMALKYRQMGDFEIDLQELCVARLGMLPDVALSKRACDLARDVRAEARKVSETDEASIVIEKSKTTESGYKVCFRKQVIQTSLPGLPQALQGSEKKAHAELTKRGVNKSLAYDLVIEARRRHGRRAFRFITFVLRIYDRDKKKGTVRGAGAIKERIMNNVFFDPAFADYMQQKRISESRRDASRYAEGVTLIGDLFEQPSNAVEKLSVEAPQVMKSILEKVEAEYSDSNSEALGIDRTIMLRMKNNALRHYAEQTIEEWKAGNTEYRPF